MINGRTYSNTSPSTVQEPTKLLLEFSSHLEDPKITTSCNSQTIPSLIGWRQLKRRGSHRKKGDQKETRGEVRRRQKPKRRMWMMKWLVARGTNHPPKISVFVLFLERFKECLTGSSSNQILTLIWDWPVLSRNCMQQGRKNLERYDQNQLYFIISYISNLFLSCYFSLVTQSKKRSVLCQRMTSIKLISLYWMRTIRSNISSRCSLFAGFFSALEGMKSTLEWKFGDWRQENSQ